MRQHVLLLQQPVRDQLPVLYLQWRWHLVRNLRVFTHVHPFYTHCNIIGSRRQVRGWYRHRHCRCYVHLTNHRSAVKAGPLCEKLSHTV